MKKDNNIPHFDTGTAWQKLDNRIYQRQAIRSAKSLIYRRIASAAAIVLIATAAVLIWKASQWQTIAAVTNNQSFLLPDGSSVLLRKGSSIRYRKTFNHQERAVSLTGEAFFQVHPNAKLPFYITTTNAEIKVLGTSFLVRSQKTTDEIVVSTGKVSVTGKRERTKQVFLEAGQKLVLQEDQWREDQINDANYIAWTTGVLDFKNTPLVKALEDVSNYYETPVGLADNAGAIENMVVTARFQSQSLKQVLEEIQLITGLEMKKDKDKVLFYKK